MSNGTFRDYAELVLLSSIWGMSFLFLRIASPVLGPFFLVETRVISSLLVMLPLLLILGKLQELRDNWRMITLIGITNMAVPFCFFAYAALNVSAGLLSIINATVPFFTGLVGFLMFRQRLSPVSIAGMGIGFVGVVILTADPQAIDGGESSHWAVPAALVACFLYGLALNLVAHKLQGVSGLTITTGSLMASSLLLIPLAAVSMPSTVPEPEVWISVLALGIVCTGLAYMLFYRLLARIGSQQAIMCTYMVPVFSILWGYLLLAESITRFTVIGCILVLLGVGMTTRQSASLAKASDRSASSS